MRAPLRVAFGIAGAVALFVACAGRSRRDAPEAEDAGVELPDAGAGMPDAYAFAGGDPTGTRCVDDQGKTTDLTAVDLCDGRASCNDGRDEADEACAFGVGYHCHGTDQRIERRRVCDGVADCPEGDDEPCFKTPPACPRQAPLVEAWLGGHSVCELKSLGRPSIDDIHYFIECAEPGHAVVPGQICNGTKDCPDGDDETDCPIACHGTLPCDFPCADGSTVTVDDLCDGANDCAGGEDEDCVDRLACSSDVGSSADFTRLCDGVADCYNADDERACPHAPSYTYFICDDGEEILFPFFGAACFKPKSPLEPHCADGSPFRTCYGR